MSNQLYREVRSDFGQGKALTSGLSVKAEQMRREIILARTNRNQAVRFSEVVKSLAIFDVNRQEPRGGKCADSLRGRQFDSSGLMYETGFAPGAFLRGVVVLFSSLRRYIVCRMYTGRLQLCPCYATSRPRRVQDGACTRVNIVHGRTVAVCTTSRRASV